MSTLYSLEFFIEKVEIKASELRILVTCGDLLDFEVKYNAGGGYNVFNTKGGGSAIVFSSSIDKIIDSFTSDFKATIIDTETVEVLGVAAIQWMSDFVELVSTLTNSSNNVTHTDTFNIVNKDKIIGTIKLQMCLVGHGETIEIPIAYLGSELAIPLSFRSKILKTPAQVITEEDWKPMFFSHDKQKKSIMDPGMELYAEMAGIKPPTPITDLLTPDYINTHLCGHKGCPGAKKFKEFGLGPLAIGGSCLGTVSSFKNAKPCGLYGMSQAYGTMDNYGAYGLFVKKKTKPPKSSCGSPDCPYTAVYDTADEIPTTDTLEANIKEIINRNKPKKCTCKNCRRNGNGSSSSKQSSRSSKGSKMMKEPCGNPNCPKSIFKEGGGPDLNNKPPRQCAGADKYNPSCPGQSCPFSGCQHNGNGSKPTENDKGYCGGTECFQLFSLQDEFTKIGSLKPSLIQENCKDKDCLFYKEEPEESPAENKNCEDITCPYHVEEEQEKEVTDEVYGLCGGKICPLEKPKKDKKRQSDIGDFSGILDDMKTQPGSTSSSPRKLTMLIDENGKKLMYSTNPDPQMNNDFLTTVSFANDADMYYLVSRLAEKQTTYSLMNYYTPDGIIDANDTDNSSPSSDEKEPKKKKRKKPCVKDSCKALKYKTCSECGGMSRSGATCDNTNISFDTISYSSDTTVPETTEPIVPPAPPAPKTTPTPGIRKKESPPKTTENKQDKQDKQLTVKIAKKRKKNSRFMYNAGEMYPGIRYGHKVCVTGAKNVPPTMGWLWNIRNEGERKRKKSWRPGVIRKDVEQRIIEHRRQRGIPDPPELKMLLKRQKTNRYVAESDSEDEEIEPKPTLTIEKKDGNYLITMNPLKDPKTLAENENPYIRCKPMQFLITKPKKEPPPAHLVSGYDDYGEDEGSDFEKYYNSCLCDTKPSSSSSSSDSELNIEFTTPAGVIIPERMKKLANVVNQDTQFKVDDFTCQDCAVIVPKKFKKEKRTKKKTVT